MKKEIDGKVYVEVDSLNELLDKANLYYNVDEDDLTGIREEVMPDSKVAVKIGKKLPPPSEIGMLENFLDYDDPSIYTVPVEKGGNNEND